MTVGGRHRGLFFVCVLAGVVNLLALDLYFAPAALSTDERPTSQGGARGEK